MSMGSFVASNVSPTLPLAEFTQHRRIVRARRVERECAMRCQLSKASAFFAVYCTPARAVINDVGHHIWSLSRGVPCSSTFSIANHYWAGFIVALILVMIGSGLLLQVKKHWT